jgi:hypothetical protein
MQPWGGETQGLDLERTVRFVILFVARTKASSQLRNPSVLDRDLSFRINTVHGTYQFNIWCFRGSCQTF